MKTIINPRKCCNNKIDDVDISVLIITYNHEAFIKQSIESVLSQNHNINVEVLVGEDCSTDSTAKILKELEMKYKNNFFVYYNKNNIGASYNLYNLITSAKGRYITLLEGDDYWIDNNKLRIMYDFLESHDDLYGVSHVRNRINSDGVIVSNDPKKSLINKTINLSDYQRNKNFSLMSTMFRRFDIEYLQKYHDAIVAARNACDFVIMNMILSLGPVYILSNVLGVYRISSNPSSYCVSNAQDKVLQDRVLQSRALLNVTNITWYKKQIGIASWRICIFYIKRKKIVEWKEYYNSLLKEEKKYFFVYFFDFIISLLSELFKI